MSDITELSQLCQKASRRTPAELIEESDLVWLSGTPAPAEKGNVALNLSEGKAVTIREKDVVKTERKNKGERFRVAVKRKSKLVVTTTDVRMAQDVSGPCQTTTTRAAARRFPFFPTLGGCMGACNQLEDDCLVSLGSSIEDALLSGDPAAMQRAARDMRRCRDLWFDCAANCFDRAFPVVARR